MFYPTFQQPQYITPTQIEYLPSCYYKQDNTELQTKVVYPSDDNQKPYPPLHSNINNQLSTRRKRYYNLDNNPYLNGSNRNHSFRSDQNIQPQFQTTNTTNLQQSITYSQQLLESKRNQSQQYQQQQYQQQQEQQLQYQQHQQQQQQQYYQQQQQLQYSQQQQQLQSQYQQSVNEQIKQSQSQNVKNQQSNILEQKFYQSQSTPFKQTAEFSQVQQQQVTPNVVQSLISYNAPKQRPGLSLDLNRYQSQTQSQIGLKRSKIFD